MKYLDLLARLTLSACCCSFVGALVGLIASAIFGHAVGQATAYAAALALFALDPIE